MTHSQTLADAIAEHGVVEPRIVIKRKGETWIEGLRIGGDFADDDDR